jgi:hypothetical protein
VELNTSRVTPVSIIARTTLMLPPTFVSKKAAGLVAERPTSISPTMWMTASTRSRAIVSVSSAVSRMSPSTTVTSTGSAARCPFTKESKTMGVCPCRRSSSTMTLPI